MFEPVAAALPMANRLSRRVGADLTRWLDTLTNPNPAYAYVDITPDSTYKCQVAREKDGH